jgi:hypothetical protein
MRNLSLSFTWDRFWQLAILVMLLRAVSGPTSFLAYLIVAIYGVRGPRQALEALLLSWYITLANPAIFGDVFAGNLGRFLVLFGVAGAAFVRHTWDRVSYSVLATLVLGSFILLHSLFFSEMASVSVLKGTMWALAMLTILLSVTSLSEREFVKTERHIYGFLVLLLLLCIPAYVLLPGGSIPGWGYLRGVLGHSQATGVLGALVAVWAFSKLVDRQQGATKDFLVFVLAVVTVFLTATRTGLLGIALTLLIVTIVAGIRGRAPLKSLILRPRNPLLTASIMVALAVAIINSEALLSSLDNFVRKGTDASSVTEAYSDSRGGQIDAMMDNIRRDPLYGIGFGIASAPETMRIRRVAGIPVGAPVEKGVIPIAVWEELGLLGLILTACWILTIVSSAIRAKLTQVSLIVAIILMSLGEASLFSAGGMGLLSMLLLGFCARRSPVRQVSSRRLDAGVKDANL